MAINIQSLFSDIIETPAQRQERMLTEGILRGRELTSGLTGLARTQAPLVAALSMQMPQRQDALRRGVGGLLGLDVRTDSERVQEALSGVDPSNPESILQAAQMIGDMGLGAQAAQMRQMAADVVRQRHADLMAQQQFSMDMAQGSQSIAESQARMGQIQANLSAARNQELNARNRVNAAAQVVAQFDPDYASQMEFIYNGDPDAAVKFAEQYVSGGSDQDLRTRKINDYTRLLFQTGDYETRADARDQAIKIADEQVEVLVDPNNPTRATLTDLIDQSVRVISSVSGMPDTQAENVDEVIANADSASVLEMLQNTTGFANVAQEFFGRTVEGLTGFEGFTAEQKTEYAQSLKALENSIIRAFSLNSRYPVGEQERIRSQIALKPEVLTGPQAAASRVAAIDNFLAQEVININNRLNNPEISSEKRSEDIILRDSINAYRDRLYPRAPSPGVLTPEVVNNMPKERIRYFVQEVYSIEDLDALSEETRQAISDILQPRQ